MTAVRAVAAMTQTRRWFRQFWDECDEATREEILAEWAGVIHRDAVEPHAAVLRAARAVVTHAGASSQLNLFLLPRRETVELHNHLIALRAAVAALDEAP